MCSGRRKLFLSSRRTSIRRLPRPSELRDRLQGGFAGRVVGTFLHLQGIDRAMAIAAQAFTALIPLLVITSAATGLGQGRTVGDAIVRRFRLTGESASQVQLLFARPTATSVGVLSAVLLLFSAVSLIRRVQRMSRTIS